MSSLQPISFTHYLAAKKTVDDRALNRHVWEALANRVRSAGRLRVLELGAGIGTMVERAWEWGLLTGEVAYTLLDADAACIAAVPERLTAWAKGRGIEAERLGERRLQLRGGARRVTLDFVAADALEFAQRDHAELWDMLIAHAFLDLIDVPAALPHLLALLRPGGLFYFTLNFDGVTTFEPVLDPALDAQIERLYHETMDRRIVNGLSSGDSRTGRHLFTHLLRAGATILAAGSSDWVVFPGPAGYPANEASFLHAILQTVENALHGYPELDAAQFAAWIAARQEQVERAELTYIAHQIDVLGTVPGGEAG
ncbi:MAG TPA: hypothetical protein PK801_13475 [Aggregatilineales bacterium]|nr:class I SAM-dependent methyltransferase [Chloroflexota bacterium]HOA24934.1 hypothetical protein [Aggregatilineales bacterium]HQA69331.1 hypothetical protein [Aggregatilineales bacterium]HQE17707.1 hypothetical protein [Aggregatilineales bacterium]